MKLSKVLNQVQRESSTSDSPSNKPPLTPGPNVKSASKYVPNTATRSSILVNIAINSLFAMGLYCLYKDYTISRENNEVAGTVKIIDQPSNKVSNKSLDEVKNSSLSLVLHSLTYRDISAFSVTMGFLGYITDVSRQSFGKKSLIYRTSLYSLFLFPSFSYLLYQYKYNKLNQKP